ncbi:hypothetical protein B0H16DRAFT_1655045 [Mycena metata]|uniref:Uncharacterized protein n=1 Tax=Mycena metata TaxID=1033252 RepID=A0AAD7GJF3_9AGAR|nr:hypothetical protein B0H16DRAFT_1655045 [Mycena metata]
MCAVVSPCQLVVYARAVGFRCWALSLVGSSISLRDPFMRAVGFPRHLLVYGATVGFYRDPLICTCGVGSWSPPMQLDLTAPTTTGFPIALVEMGSQSMIIFTEHHTLTT